MKRVRVKLSELQPNPYKKEIQGGYIDPLTVAQIKESATKTSFWEQWVVREVKDGYQLAFGHHRLAAAIELYGPNYQVSVQQEDYTDEQMLIALADENAGREEAVEAQVDVIRIAREYLKEHPEACKVSADSLPKPNGGRPHEHGSRDCLLAFLGKDNWNHQKIGSLLSIADRFDTTLLKDVAQSETHPERQAVIGITSATALAELEKPAQRIAVQALKDAGAELNKFKKKEISSRRSKSQPHAGVSKMITHIPASVVKHAVKQAENLPPEKQGPAVAQIIKANVEERKELAISISLPTAESVISKTIAQLYNFPPDEVMQELLANRQHLSAPGKLSLLVSFNKHIDRITGYRDLLVSPPPKRLGK